MKGSLSRSSSVLALIPHFRCEQWLAEAIGSLVGQTRPLDGIVVIDDGSPLPPVHIVTQFPQVTLLAAESNVGPYRLVQQVIQDTQYDAYLFQDADDWSSSDRLIRLLRGAERTEAELIGSYEVRVPSSGATPLRVRYPQDCNAALAREPADHVQLHPSTLVSGNLLARAGGFATGLRFGADTELIHRVHYIARCVNLPRYCYFRRERPDSLTASSDTGLSSPRRLELIELLHQRARQNAARVSRGQPPDLTPYSVAEPVKLHHLTGPRLRRKVAMGPAGRAGPLVSVIVPVFNGERYLAECLNSIFAQDYQPFEVIVVDDGSTDRTAEVVRSFPSARYIYQENRGPSGARNTGIAAARGDFVAFFDHDDLMMPNKLSIQVGYLLSHPDTAFVVGREKVFCEPGVELPALVKADPLTGELGGSPEMSAVVRKNVLDEVGGFDPNFPIAEDTEWVSRLFARGFKRHACPEIVMLRRFHGANLSYQNPADMTLMLRVLKARVAENRASRRENSG